MNSNPSKLRREGAAAEHQAILDAVLEHDPDRASDLLAEHYRKTLEGLRHVIPLETSDTPEIAVQLAAGSW